MLLLMILAALTLLYAGSAIALHFRNRRRMKAYREWANSHVNYDNATCDVLRKAGWSEKQIQNWCNSTRTVYYSPEYNSTDL